MALADEPLLASMVGMSDKSIEWVIQRLALSHDRHMDISLLEEELVAATERT
jgi:hypothetical protein